MQQVCPWPVSWGRAGEHTSKTSRIPRQSLSSPISSTSFPAMLKDNGRHLQSRTTDRASAGTAAAASAPAAARSIPMASSSDGSPMSTTVAPVSRPRTRDEIRTLPPAASSRKLSWLSCSASLPAAGNGASVASGNEQLSRTARQKQRGVSAALARAAHHRSSRTSSSLTPAIACRSFSDRSSGSAAASP